MKLHRPSWRGALLSAGVVAVAAGVTFGATLLFGMPFGGDDATTAGAHVPGTRDKLAICVDVYDPGGEIASVEDIRAGARSAVLAGLEKVVAEPEWSRTGLDKKGAPVVDVGCPTSPLPARNDDDLKTQWKDGSGPFAARIAAVTEPNHYFLFVFVAPLEQIDSMLGGTAVRLSGQEYIYEGDVSWPVTHAMYVTPEELKDEPFFLQRLEEALGVREVQWP